MNYSAISITEGQLRIKLSIKLKICLWQIELLYLNYSPFSVSYPLSCNFASPFTEVGLYTIIAVWACGYCWMWILVNVTWPKPQEAVAWMGWLLNFSLQERDIAASSVVQGDEIYLGESYMADLKTWSWRHSLAYVWWFPTEWATRASSAIRKVAQPIFSQRQWQLFMRKMLFSYEFVIF